MDIKSVLQVTDKQKKDIQHNSRSEQEINNDLVIIREWLVKQPHLPKNIESYLIIRMLRLNKFSLEKTKKKLDMYYSCRTLVPEYFGNRDPISDKMQQYLDTVTLIPLPTLTKTNCRIFVLRFNNKNPDLFDVDQHATYFLNILDLGLHNDTAESHIYIMDYRNMVFGHIVKLNLAFVKKVVTIMLEGFSVKINSIHLVFMPAFANTLMEILQSLLKHKIAGRIIAHKSIESLHKEIDKNDLPSDFGGSLKSIGSFADDWNKVFKSQRPWFLEQEKIKSNEKLRIGETIDEEIFGSIHGSFRVLNVD